MKLPQSPPEYRRFFEDPAWSKRFADIYLAAFGPDPDSRYRHWDILRHLQPPVGFTHEEWWLGIKMARRQMYRPLPLADKNHEPFQYMTTDTVFRRLSEIDKQATGAIRASDQVADPQSRDTYIMTSLMEEAITSSQLEGASTTRDVAKEMIRSGRLPTTKSERMIFNNFHAMMFIREIKHEQLTPEIIFELHSMLTQGTLDDADAAGRLRNADESIHVVDAQGRVLHVPPPARELEGRMKAMCDFANNVSGSRADFLHPVVRSILLHFWLAYDHPFIDGNGRTARALFYWSMAHADYWLFEFISISTILNRARGQYEKSFLYTESDDNDATYFIQSQLRVIQSAIAELHKHLHRTAAQLEATRRLIQHSPSLRRILNHRQLSLINHALKNPHHGYTIESHRSSHQVSYPTARADLLALSSRGLLDEMKISGKFYFQSPSDLKARIAHLDTRDAETKT